MAERIKKEVKKSTGVEALLDFLARIILLGGIAIAVYVLATLGVLDLDSSRYSSDMEINAAGMAASLSILISSVAVYALFRGLAEVIRVDKFKSDLPYKGRVYDIWVLYACSDCGYEHGGFPASKCLGCKVKFDED